MEPWLKGFSCNAMHAWVHDRNPSRRSASDNDLRIFACRNLHACMQVSLYYAKLRLIHLVNKTVGIYSNNYSWGLMHFQWTTIWLRPLYRDCQGSFTCPLILRTALLLKLKRKREVKKLLFFLNETSRFRTNNYLRTCQCRYKRSESSKGFNYISSMFIANAFDIYRLSPN